MSTYRCPICGANHKDNVPQCRLCGADMTGRPLPTAGGGTAPPPVSPKGSVKGIVFIGLGLVLLLVLAAVGFGFIRSQQVESVSQKVLGNHTDGWTTQTEPDTTNGASTPSGSVGHFSVELPGDRTRETIDFTGTTDGKLVTWTAKIADDSVLQVGWGKIAPAPVGSGPNGTFADQGPTRQLYLKDVAQKWMTAKGIGSNAVTQGNTSFGGLPGYEVKSITPNTTVKDKPAYYQVGFAINNDVLYVIMETSIYRDAEQYEKLKGTFQVLA